MPPKRRKQQDNDEDERMICCDYCDRWFYLRDAKLTGDTVDLIETFACTKCKKRNSDEFKTTWLPTCRLTACMKPVSKGKRFCSDTHGQAFFRSSLEKVRKKKMAVAVVNHITNETCKSIGDQIPQVDISNFLSDSKPREDKQERLRKERGEWEMLERYLSMLQEQITKVNDERREQELEKEKNKKSKKKVNNAQIVICGLDQAVMVHDWGVIKKCIAEGSVDSRIDGLCTELKQKCHKHKDWLRIAQWDISKHLELIDDKLVELDNESYNEQVRARQLALVYEGLQSQHKVIKL